MGDKKYIVTNSRIGVKLIELGYLQHLCKMENGTHIYIERNTYNGADLVKIKEIISNDCELSARKFEFINQHQTKNKDDKISTIIDGVNSGAIVFNKENEEFNNQVLEFSGQKTSLHDDALDVVSEFVKRIDEIEVLQPIKVYDLSYIGL